MVTKNNSPLPIPQPPRLLSSFYFPYAMHFPAFIFLLQALTLFFTSEVVAIGHGHHRRHHHPKRVTSVLYGATPSSTHSAAPTQTPDSPSNTSSGDAIFPLGRGLMSWTTHEGVEDALPISDSTFRPTVEARTLTHNTVTSPGPNSKPAMEAVYAKGSWDLHRGSDGGFSFYAPGPQHVDLTLAKEATFGYSVMFQEGWEWNLGGKLPGFYGGDDEQVATTCSGGRHNEGCWSARLMWRKEGKGEVYTYLPPKFEENDVQCHVEPLSTCNPTYGASVGRGAFNFQAGQWTTVAQRVRLNDAGQSNGEIELFVGGESKIKVSGLVLRGNSAGRIRGIQIQTFFGGSTAEWASPQDQTAYFSDFSVAILDTL